MHYGIIAVGSRGDVQPFVALALGLIDRGHKVTVMAHENFKGFVEGYGPAFHPLPGNVEDMLYTPEGQKVLRDASMLVFMRFVQKVVAQNQAKVNEELLAGAKGVDVLVTSLLGVIWVDAIAAKLGKPWATIQLSFPSTPTGDFPFALLGFFDFPWYNRFTYRVFDFLYTRDYKKQLNEFRRSLGLSPVEGSILKKITAEKTPNLYALSPTILPRPTDWDERSQVTGFIFLPPERREQNPADRVPSELIGWLAAGEKPIYIGFGSIPAPDPPRFTHILNRLLTETTYRFVFCQGWSRLDRLDGLPSHPNLFVVPFANHDWLFPRCRAAIIHGGIGTVATGLRAKIPMVIASIVADQPWWGQLIERKGLGVHLPFRRWTTEKLLAAIRRTETAEIQARVMDVGERIAHDNGLAQTIAMLQDYFEKKRIPS
jgi:sterol 3beta-glucosyltransferase